MSKFTRQISHFTATIAAMVICSSLPATVHADCTPQWIAGFGNPEGPLSGPAMATAVFDDGHGPALYAAGDFVSYSGISIYSVTKWNGSSWANLGTGPQGTVRALAVFDDGSGPALYAGGDFTQEGGAPANHISKWNGGDWSTVGAGLSGTVWAFTVFDDGSGPALYAGGAFTSAGGGAANNIAKWNGTTWSAVGTGTGGIVRTLGVFNDGSGAALYAGGDFVSAGGSAVQRMARWNGTAWSSMPGMNDTVWSLHASGGSLYAGGAFTTAGGGAAKRIAKWNGTTWSAVGTGMNDAVYALTDFNDGTGSALYAAGAFTQADGVGANRVAKWNGTAWSVLAGGADTDVRTLTAFDDGTGNRLFAGGLFHKLDSHAVKSVGAWNGSVWRALGGEGGTDGYIQRLLSFDDGSGPALYATGGFGTAGSVNAKGLAKWNGSTWSALNAANTTTGALEVVDDGSGPHLFVATKASSSSFGVAKWDGTTLTTIATGLRDPVQSIAGFDDGTGSALYAGGPFRSAGGPMLNGIAKLDGTSWSPLGAGFDNGPVDPDVSDMSVFDDGNGPALYVGGQFNTAGGLAVGNIAKWDGAAWSKLGNGINTNYGNESYVSSLAAFDDGSGPALYAGGRFWMEGIESGGIARWNGASWSSVGNGFNGAIVISMAVFDDGNGLALYVAGYGIGAIGDPYYPYRLGKWDGHAWQFAETGSNQEPITLAVFDSGSSPKLFMGGWFTSAGNRPAHHIAAMSGCNFIVQSPPAPPPPPLPTPDPVDPVVVPSDPAPHDQATPDPVVSVDNGALAEPQDQAQAPIATGAGPCGMGMGMSASGLLTGMWMMRRSGSRRRRAANDHA